jgi:folate-dependent tRNA-U54 methylase TrmFO/GidA
MNANYGLIEGYPKKIRNKQERYGHIAARSLDYIEALRSNPLACDFYEGGC